MWHESDKERLEMEVGATGMVKKGLKMEIVAWVRQRGTGDGGWGDRHGQRGAEDGDCGMGQTKTDWRWRSGQDPTTRGSHRNILMTAVRPSIHALGM